MLRKFGLCSDFSDNFQNVRLCRVIFRQIYDKFDFVQTLKHTVLRSPPWLGKPLRNICVTTDHGDVTHSGSFLIHNRVCNYSNMTGATIGDLTTYPSGTPGFIPGVSGVGVPRSLILCVLFCRSLFVPLSFFLLAIVLSVHLRLHSLISSNSSSEM